MRILYLTQTFPPDPGPTARPLQQAVQLRRLGHQITVLTTMPSASRGRTLPGYRWRLWVREEMEGVEVLRVWSLPSPNRGYVGRLFSWTSFAAVATVVGLFGTRRDLIAASVPKPGTELAGMIIARLRRSRYLLELRDLLPDSLAFIGISCTTWGARALSRYVLAHCNTADAVAIPSQVMKAALVARGVPRGRVLLLPHAYDEVRSSMSPPRLGDVDELQVLYAGSFSAYYDIPTIVAAARVLEDRNAPVHVHLLGTGRQRVGVETHLLRAPCASVTMHDPIPPGEVPGWLKAADVLLAPLVSELPVSFMRDYLNTKSTEYFAAGRAIVAIESEPIIGPLLERTGAGESVPARDPIALASVLTRLAEDRDLVHERGVWAQDWARQHLRREIVVGRFESELLTLLGPREPNGSDP